MAKKVDLRSWPGTIPIQSLYTTGVGGQIFFRALKESGELVATRCDACQQVYLPARQFCERCFAELKVQVKLPAQGILKSFTFCSVDRDGAILNPPLVLA